MAVRLSPDAGWFHEIPTEFRLIAQGSGIRRNPGLNYAAPLGHNHIALA